MELSAPLCFELLWGMLCPWLRNMFPCVSDKVNTCDAKDRVLSTSVSIHPAGKLRAALGNGWPATKFAWQHSSVILERLVSWVFDHGFMLSLTRWPHWSNQLLCECAELSVLTEGHLRIVSSTDSKAHPTSLPALTPTSQNLVSTSWFP